LTPEQRTVFDSTGAIHVAHALSAADLDRIAALFGDGDRPGSRLIAHDVRAIAHLLREDGPIGAIAGALIGPRARPVRAILLDKSPEANWRLGWHQDRTIAVEERIDVDGYGPWSVKAGQTHVQPPHEVTAAMVTLRIHVDDVDTTNAPLEVLPGSHLLGRLSNEQVDQLQIKLTPQTCLARAGDIWAYATAIVHRSAEQRRSGRRRVLQVDFSAVDLPAGLTWAELI
jgi:hypothetical protein